MCRVAGAKQDHDFAVFTHASMRHSRHAINEHRLAKAKRLHYAQPLTLQYPPRPLQICGVGGAGSAAEKRKKAHVDDKLLDQSKIFYLWCICSVQF